MLNYVGYIPLMKTILSITIALILLVTVFLGSTEFLRLYFPNDKNQEVTEDIDSRKEDQVDNSYQYYKDNTLRVLITKLPFELVYNPNQTRMVRDVAEDFDFKILINGGFFNANKEYAGALIVDGELVSNPAPLDKQLSHVVIYNKDLNQMYFELTTEFNPYSENYPLAFQTGPLFLENNIVQEQYIDNSVNGNGEYLRSFIGYTDYNELVVGITTDGYSLKDLVEKILSIELFEGKKLSLINLDGGSSVSLYAGKNSDLNYGELKTLPILLGFK